VDEIWGFVITKQKFAKPNSMGPTYGIMWTWMAIDADTKMVLGGHSAAVHGRSDRQRAQPHPDHPRRTQRLCGRDATSPKQKLICAACAGSVAYNVAKFCWFNKTIYGGSMFCMKCQKKV